MTTATKTTMESYAHLDVLEYEKIKKRDARELERLVKVGKSDGGRGLFFLDLRGSTAGHTLQDAQRLYGAAARFFDKSADEKNIFHREGAEDGFNAYGDVEVFEIARDEHVHGTLRLPQELDHVQSELGQFLSTIDTVTRDIYHAFGSTLDPPDPLATAEYQASDTGLQLAWARPEAHEGKVIAPAHTDRGLLTLLYYEDTTLEVPVDGTDEWRLVKPLEGAVVGYVGKALETTSHGRLSAPVHRVVAPKAGTYVAAYLLRPAFGSV